MGEPVVIAVTADEIAQATFVADMQQIVREASAMFSLNPKEACKMEPIRRPKLPRRNEKCPCGSGLKAKNCCLPQMKALASIPPDVRRQIIVNRILRRPATPLPAVPENLAKLNGAGVIQFDGGTGFVFRD